jgi:proteasome alpha subunit
MSYAGNEQGAFDKHITVFSPDGRLYQVEYAREAVKRGTPAVGIAIEEGVILMTHKRVLPLQRAETIEKLYKIDEHVTFAAAGLQADARALVDMARQCAQQHRVTYDEPVGIPALVESLCDHMRSATHGGYRPYGVGFIVGGTEDGKSRLYETDPSGTFIGYDAVAIGFNRHKMVEILEKEYDYTMDSQSAISLAVKVLESSKGEPIDKAHIDCKLIEC